MQRWLAGRVPHPRHRWSIADLLGVREEALWPQTKPSTTARAAVTNEILAAYAHRAEVPPHLWYDLITQADRQIDLLGYAMLFLPESNPNLAEQLREKAAADCTIRIALVDPDSPEVAARDAEEGLAGALPGRIRTALHYFAELANGDGISLHLHSTKMYNSIFRFDDEMLVTPHLYGEPGYMSPALHLRRLGPYGIFDNFALHFERVWATSARIDGAG